MRSAPPLSPGARFNLNLQRFVDLAGTPQPNPGDAGGFPGGIVAPFTYRQPSAGQPAFALVEGDHDVGLVLDRFVGRYSVICCYGSGSLPEGRAALEALQTHVGMFDDVRASFVGITINPAEPVKTTPRPGVHFVFDKDGSLSRHCGALPIGATRGAVHFRVTWMLVDPALRVLAHFTTTEASDCEPVFDLLRGLPDPATDESLELPAPILIFPKLFDSGLCERLIDLYQSGETRDSGYMFKNVETFDYGFKRRRDYFITEDALQKTIMARVSQCVVPEIRKLFFMSVTHMERYLVARYAANEAGHFRAHRDNGQIVTQHRRFALSVALNDDFEGGELSFPEYGRRRYRTPRGSGLLFPCAAMHAVGKVTRGERFVFLPFLYDDEGARLKRDA